MSTSRISLPVLVLFLALSCSGSLAAMRPADPMIVTGSNIFDGAPVSDLHLFAFTGEEWIEIPAQIDERSIDGSLFNPDDGFWDANDELVFQPQDGGIIAGASQWIDDAESTGYARLRIETTDPVEGDSSVVYLFRSSAIGDTVSTSYLFFDAANDELSTPDYQLGLDAVHKFWDELRLFEDGGFGDDLLDRRKIRIKGQILFSQYLLDEEDLQLTDFSVVAGPVRVTTRTQGTYSVFGLNFPNTEMGQYYRSFLAAHDNAIDMDSSVSMMRTSTDFTPVGNGGTISTADNPALIVDGFPEMGVVLNIPAEQLSHFWLKISFAGNTLVTVADFAGLSASNKLYFRDDVIGGTNDGTSDTGDMASWGDVGLWFEDPIAGNHNVRSSMYAAVDADLSGPVCQAWFDNPLQCTVISETLDLSPVTDDSPAVPRALLLANRPNPFNPRTVISYRLSGAENVELTVFDAKGRRVQTLVNSHQPAGDHEVTWQPAGIGSGVYFLHLRAGAEATVRRCTVLK